MSVVNAIISSRILVFDVIRAQLNQPNERVFLLKRSADSSGFEIVAYVANGWRYFRKKNEFHFATLQPGFKDLFAVASEIAYGVIDADAQIDVYEIIERDDLMVNGEFASYACIVLRSGNERFTLPEIMDGQPNPWDLPPPPIQDDP